MQGVHDRQFMSEVSSPRFHLQGATTNLHKFLTRHCNPISTFLYQAKRGPVEMTAPDSKNDFDPVHSRLSPTAQVASHILQKGYQAGSVVGSLVVLPASVALAWLYYKKPVSPSDLIRRVGISCVAGVAATGMKVTNLNTQDSGTVCCSMTDRVTLPTVVQPGNMQHAAQAESDALWN
jgi:hypothetical protein